MATLYLKSSTYTSGGANPNLLFALAGDSPGTQANWIEGNVQALANAWGEQYGTWVGLSDTNWVAFKGYYQQPVTTTSV